MARAKRQCRNDDKSLCEREIVRERDIDTRNKTFRGQSLEATERAACERERLLDAPDVDKVGANAQDHAGLRALSISARMRLIASTRPSKIASPMRKWPMLSST